MCMNVIKPPQPQLDVLRYAHICYVPVKSIASLFIELSAEPKSNIVYSIATILHLYVLSILADEGIIGACRLPADVYSPRVA